MKGKVRLFLLLSALVLLIGLSTACSKTITPQNITVVLVNASNEECHLMIGHETGLNASNKVAPGSSLSYHAMVDTEHIVENRFSFEDAVRCVAGKDGKIVKTSKVRLAGDYVNTVTIVWSGASFKLRN